MDTKEISDKRSRIVIKTMSMINVMMTAVMKKIDPEEIMKPSEIETGVNTRYRLKYEKEEKEEIKEKLTEMEKENKALKEEIDINTEEYDELMKSYEDVKKDSNKNKEELEEVK
jgi:predicted nuclease with TOPRIM domain